MDSERKKIRNTKEILNKGMIEWCCGSGEALFKNQTSLSNLELPVFVLKPLFGGSNTRSIPIPDILGIFFLVFDQLLEVLGKGEIKRRL